MSSVSNRYIVWLINDRVFQFQRFEGFLVLSAGSRYQMNPGNYREALIETSADESEGADILMVRQPYVMMQHQSTQEALRCGEERCCRHSYCAFVSTSSDADRAAD